MLHPLVSNFGVMSRWNSPSREFRSPGIQASGVCSEYPKHCSGRRNRNAICGKSVHIEEVSGWPAGRMRLNWKEIHLKP